VTLSCPIGHFVKFPQCRNANAFIATLCCICPDEGFHDTNISHNLLTAEESEFEMCAFYANKVWSEKVS
jgi:hypothetical protein